MGPDLTPPQITPSPSTTPIVNIARSMFALGIFLTIAGTLFCLVAISAHSSLPVVLLLVAYMLLGLSLMIVGKKMKHTADILEAKKYAHTGTIICVAIVIIGIIRSVVAHQGFLGVAGVLGLVALIYILVVQRKLR